jgi:hypothetical protein
VVEIVTTVAETGDWRAALARSIPKRRAYHHTGEGRRDQLPNGQDGVTRAPRFFPRSLSYLKYFLSNNLIILDIPVN